MEWIEKPDRKVVLGEVQALDADGKVLLCFILTQLVVNHSQVICCSTTRLERLFKGGARNWNIFSYNCLKWIFIPTNETDPGVSS